MKRALLLFAITLGVGWLIAFNLLVLMPDEVWARASQMEAGVIGLVFGGLPAVAAWWVANRELQR